MKKLIKSAIVSIGLEAPARGILRNLKARGWLSWTPLVSQEAFKSCVDQAIARLREVEPSASFGDYLEFGVSRGTSLACVFQCFDKAGMHQTRFIGFDSFEGMPPESAQEGWDPGQFHSTIEATQSYLKQEMVDLRRVNLVKGWFKDTLTEEPRRNYSLDKASLIMIDCDIYSASKDALVFCEPHIHKHAVIFFDDWGWREEAGEKGQKEAFAEFLAQHRHLKAEPLPTYLPQARVFFVSRATGDV